MVGHNQQEEVPLDVRLRNLILQNAANQPQHVQAPGAPSDTSSPSHTMNQPAHSAPSQNSRQRRPNQAQRRQMSAQMTVPIETRSAQPQVHAGPPFRQHQQSVHGSQQMQSGPFQPSRTNNGFARGGPYPPNNRHHPSPAYSAVAPASGSHGWRQPSGMQNGVGGNHPGARPNQGGRNSNGQGRSLYNPQAPYQPRQDNNLEAQVALLEQLASSILANAEIDHAQIQEKEQFRLLIEDACRSVIERHERETNGQLDFPTMSVQLRCFGSLAAGFATKASDMDLGLLSPFSQPQPDNSDSQIPRIVEKVFLEMGLGARLLTKTRVPIIKVCQKPPPGLYNDLLKEREKWERGEDEQDLDQDLEEEDVASAPSSSPVEEKQPAEKAFPANDNGTEKAVSVNDSGSSNESYQNSLNQLKQGSKSLGNYYGAAQKLLRKLGAKDVTSSKPSKSKADDDRVLEDVCDAFIRGLADNDLRVRLQKYPTRHRSLFGAMAQIEGEKLVVASESRSVMEKLGLSETQLQNRIAHWVRLQNSKAYQDPLSFNRELQLASDAIKKFPSVDVLVLEQKQHEWASTYHAHAVRVLVELGGHDSPQSNILPLVLDKFVRGIYDFEIRQQVSDFVRSLPGPSLRVAARRHKSLQLAKEFEKALEKDLYPAESVDDLKQYIELLRSPMEVTSAGGVQIDAAIVMTSESRDLVSRIRGLQDPARMTPNQPRDRYSDKLEFPKSDIGVQCDINFSAQLALQNTHLLRCYAQTDPRVRPLVLFIKHWAKIRGINTPYRGTLSSYGYVLMVLHYLTNVCQPYVCPNLQQMAAPVPPNLTQQQIESTVEYKGRNICFWRDEEQIKAAAQRGELSRNTDPLGFLLRGFFEYYAQGGMMSTYHVRGFDWGRDVLSLRTLNGLMSKNEKGWTGAKTVLEVRGSDKPAATTTTEPALPQANPTTNDPADSMINTQSPTEAATGATPATKSSTGAAKPEVKEVRHRYLFAIEDPFELDHNVARTVTHQGIVAIRDEFRRAWKIIKLAGLAGPQENLLQDATTEKKAGSNKSFLDLLDEIHGRQRA